MTLVVSHRLPRFPSLTRATVEYIRIRNITVRAVAVSGATAGLDVAGLLAYADDDSDDF